MNLLGRYKELRSQPRFDDYTDGQLAAALSTTLDEVRRLKRMHPEAEAQVLDRRRKGYADDLLQVDQALFEKAKAGDARAADLVYRRFENWTPKQADEALKRAPQHRTFAQLLEEEDA